MLNSFTITSNAEESRQ